MLEINKVLDCLSQCKPYRPSNNKNRIQRIADWIAKYSLTSGIAAFLVLCGATIVNKYFYKLSAWPLKLALIGYLISMILMVISMIAVIVSEAASFFDNKRLHTGEESRSADPEIETDERHVAALADFESPVLSYAQRHLQLKVGRMDRRISFFFGEKVALVSLFIFASTQLKAAGGATGIETAFQNWSAPAHYLDTFLLASLALGAGIALGSLTLKYRQRSYLYQLDLIEMAFLRRSLVKDIREKKAEARHAHVGR